MVIEAIQWNGSNEFEIWNYFEDNSIRLKEEGTLLIRTLEGDHIASVGDYIIKGINLILLGVWLLQIFVICTIGVGTPSAM